MFKKEYDYVISTQLRRVLQGIDLALQGVGLGGGHHALDHAPRGGDGAVELAVPRTHLGPEAVAEGLALLLALLLGLRCRALDLLLQLGEPARA